MIQYNSFYNTIRRQEKQLQTNIDAVTYQWHIIRLSLLCGKIYFERPSLAQLTEFDSLTFFI